MKLETEFVGCQFSVFLNISKHLFDRKYNKMLYILQIAPVANFSELYKGWVQIRTL